MTTPTSTLDLTRILRAADLVQLGREHGRPRRPLSVRQLSLRLGYRSDRALGMVQSGRRPMSVEMLQRLTRYLKLSPKEHRYAELLLFSDHYGRRGEVNARENTLAELARLRAKTATYQTMSVQALARIEDWFCYPVLRVVAILGPDANLSTISAAFAGRLKRRDLERAVETWRALGRLRRDGDRITFLDPEIYAQSSIDIPSPTIRRIHRKMLLRAIDTIEDQSVEERELMTKTLVVRKTDLPAIKKRLREVIEEFSDEILVSPGSAGPAPGEALVVYQLSLQFFAQADPSRDRRSGG